ncbi:MAG: HAD family hydrolase [Candidatus Latescibacteria bacterium]|nr:HAD family hydrolase [Candidatus Latescibacterota bacterium]
MKFKAVLFDGYGTLFEDAMVPLRELCGRIIQGNGLALEPDAFLEAWDRHFFPMIRGDFVTLREADVVSLERLFGELRIADAAHLHIDGLFERFNSAPIYPDVRPALEGLDVGMMTGILSNADVENIDGALRANDLNFPVVITSEGVRCYKPRPEIFRQALALLGCEAEEALYVGDSQEDDVTGARGVGMRVAWLNRRGERLRQGIPAPDYEIENLKDVLKIVGP